MVVVFSVGSGKGIRAASKAGSAVFALIGILSAAGAQDAPKPAQDVSAQSDAVQEKNGSTENALAEKKTEPTSDAPARKFTINAYDITGNTMLGERAIDMAVEPYLGPNRLMSDIDDARKSLEKAYQSAGYQTVYVVIPKQTVRGGVVKLHVVEARIGDVTVSGSEYSSASRFLDSLPSLKSDTVPNLTKLNDELVQFNSENPDRQVTPEMKPGEEPQTIGVDLQVKDQLALHGGLEINNRYSRDTHQYRIMANAAYTDLWQMGHALSALYSVAPENPADGEVYALTYSAPIPANGVKLSLTGLRSNSNVTTLGTTDVLGRGWSGTLSATVPLGIETLLDDGDYFHYLQFSGAYKRFENTISLSGEVSSAPITYYPFMVGYTAFWHDMLDQVSFTASMTFSFRGLGSSQSTFDWSRYEADGNFLYFRGTANWLRTLPLDFEFYASFYGQYSNGPLISNEQFSIGGDGSVRGYLQSEGLGDSGVQGTVEIRSPNLAGYLGGYVDGILNEWRLIGFADAGGAWLHDPLSEQQVSYGLFSIGGGTTLQMLEHVNGTLYWTYPLRDNSSRHDQSGVTDYGQSRIQFRVWTQF